MLDPSVESTAPRGAVPQPIAVARAEDAIRRWNLEGLRLLSTDPVSAFQLFARAQREAEDPDGALAKGDARGQVRALAATENNLGLFYFREARLESAAHHIGRACELEGELGAEASTPGATLLNLAHVQSQQGDTRGASVSSLKAVSAQRLRLAGGTLLPFERDKETRLLAKALGYYAELLHTQHKFDEAAAAFKSSSETYHQLTQRDDLQKGDEMRLKSLQCVDAPSRLPRLEEAPWRPTSVYRTAASEPAKLQRPASGSAARSGSAASRLQRVEPIATEIKAGPVANSYRFDKPQPPACGKPSGADTTRPKSARTSRRSSYASDTIAANVYSGLQARHREAFDALRDRVEATRVAVANARDVPLTTITDKGKQSHRAALSALSCYDPPAAASRPSDFRRMVDSQAGVSVRPPSAPASRTLGGRQGPSVAGGAAKRTKNIGDAKDNHQSSAGASGGVDAPPSVTESSIRQPVTAATADDLIAGDADVPTNDGVDTDTSASGEDLEATNSAAVVVQRSWRGYRGKRAAQARREERVRLEEERNALIRRIREEEQVIAAANARRDLAAREATLELRRREIELTTAAARRKIESKREAKANILAELMQLGSELDALQQHVAEGALPTRAYLHTAHEARRQQRFRAAAVLQAVARSILSGRVSKERHAEQFYCTLREWAQRRLETHAAKRLQSFFKATIGVLRAESIAEAQRVAKIARDTRVVMLAQAMLRQRSAALVSARRFASKVVRGVTLFQAVFRSKVTRAALQWALEAHRTRQLLLRESEVLIKLHSGFAQDLLVEDQRWWDGLVESHMDRKPLYAANKIKAVWRRHHYGREPEARWRANLVTTRAQAAAKRRAEFVATRALGAARLIQRCYRQHLAKRQRNYRLQLRLQAKIDYLEREWRAHSALVLQGFAAVIAAKREKQHRRETLRQLALVKRWRAEKAQEELALLQQAAHESAMAKRLQSCGRAALVRFHLRRHRWNVVRAWELFQSQLIIARVGRGSAHRLQVGAAQAKRTAATAAARCLIRMEAAGLTIASATRGYHERRLCAKQLDANRSAAASKIASYGTVFRARKERERRAEEKRAAEARTEASQLLHHVVIGYRARLQCASDMDVKRAAAASKIASYGSVFRARKERERRAEEKRAVADSGSLAGMAPQDEVARLVVQAVISSAESEVLHDQVAEAQNPISGAAQEEERTM